MLYEFPPRRSRVLIHPRPSHNKDFKNGTNCICRRVAPDYAADFSVPILDHGRNAKERKIGSSTMCRPNYYYYYIIKRFLNNLLFFLNISFILILQSDKLINCFIDTRLVIFIIIC